MANNSYWSKRVNCSYWSEAANFSYINRTADPSYQASSTNLAYKTNSSSKLYRYPLESDRRETEAQHLFFYLFKDSVSGTLVVQQVCLTCSWQTPVLPSASLSLFPQCQAPDLASRWKRTNWFRRDECRSPSSCLEASRKIEFHQASATPENIQATENRSELVLFFILGLPPPWGHFLSLFSWCPKDSGDKIVPVRTDFRRIELKSLQESFTVQRFLQKPIFPCRSE